MHQTFRASTELPHKDKAFNERMRASSMDFWLGVRPLIETQFKARVMPLEMLQDNELVRAFDHVGIDAFYIDRQGNLKGLASRMNYSPYASNKPAFTLRYAKWDPRLRDWDFNCEYQRKLAAAQNPEKFHFFPELHVESFSLQKSKGIVGWSYLARTADIVKYIQENLRDTSKVEFFEPRFGEKRNVVVVPVEPFAKHCDLHEVKILGG